MKPVALVDLDGTLADYYGGMRKALEPLQHPDRPLPEKLYSPDAPSWLRAQMKMARRVPGFWKNLESLPVGMGVYQILRSLKYRIMILTKGPRNTTNAWTEKAEWCRERVPHAEVTITHDKGLVEGTVLVDDFPPYVNGWIATHPNGLVIMPATVHNREYTHPQVVKLSETPASEEWDAIEKTLTHAHDAAKRGVSPWT